ncbi:MAG: diaminopropionate ammonia-lyase [Rhodospirillaceae bacterium]|nr:diaminopropionate ammonia-lyase [Rhodospirillaceae bacterium]
MSDALADMYINPGWVPCRAEDEAGAGVLSAVEMDRAWRTITAWPDYAPTPLRPLPGLAAVLGLGAVLCKDESHRFGAGGVKALGAPYGLQTLLAGRDLTQPFTAVAATDGNHGLALAWAARRCGGRARIFVGRDVDSVRLSRIRAFDAEIVVIDGTYDDAVLAARDAAAEPDCLLVADTDYGGDLDVCRAIMAGYAVLGEEAWEQGLSVQPPTHVFLQCGVGGVAGGVSALLWHRLAPAVPRVILVEPTTAACALSSLRAGRPVQVAGDLRTRMAGLSCGRLSQPAWDILSRVVLAGIAIGDACAERAQDVLSLGESGDPGLATWDTGVSGLAGLIAAAGNSECRRALGLDVTSRVFVVNSEGPPP